ncbi:MAG: DUF89 family protein [Clostridia bacterium]|nr:DUF89 family protein [Clostridia bacterium]
MSDYKIAPQCVDCIAGKYLSKAPKTATVEQQMEYKLKVLKTIAELGESVTAPEIVAAVTGLKNEMFGKIDDFAEEKRYFNALMLSLADEIEQQIVSAEDPFKTALKFAQLGNYIDFGAMYSVDENQLREMLKGVSSVQLDETEYENLKRDLSQAKRLVYLTDNCGEIVMDKLLVRQIKKQFKGLDVTVVVRGGPVLNDATMEDAEQVGLDREVSVVSNGTLIAGTALRSLPENVRSKVLSADVILSKGQGNFETLKNCGLNVYYLFLCKCNMFAEHFGVPKLTGMFINDLRMKS